MTINESEFPNLRKAGYVPQSDPDERYNCIAWAAGENHRWWEPCDGRHWPGRKDGDPPDYSIASLASAYAAEGFVECGGCIQDDAAHEQGIQKVALYGQHGEYLHAARQLINGEWTSKLGPDDDIRHPSLEAVTGGAFGDVVKIMKRPYPDGAVLGDDEIEPRRVAGDTI